MALDRDPFPAGEEPEASIETPGQLGRVHRRHPRRCELDRQRHPIETPTHLRDSLGVAGVDREVGLCRPRPIHEQPHRFTFIQRSEVHTLVGHVE